MDLFVVIIRTLFFYLFIFVIYRIMGKREIGQLSIIDLVVSILIAELVAISIENHEDSILLAIFPILILVILEMVTSFTSIRSNKFRKFVQGKPALIINEGKINFKEMSKQRYTLDDLLLELRQNGYKSIEEIEYAVLENNGTLSVFPYKLLKVSTPNPYPLILDGTVQEDTLNLLNKDKIWLNELLLKDETELDEVFYAFYKGNKVFIIKKNEIN